MSRANRATPVFDAIRLAAVARHVSREESRFYLGGVRFEAAPEGGALAVATDGHSLGAAHDPEGRAAEGVWRFDTALLALAQRKGGRVAVKPFGSAASGFLAHLSGETAKGLRFDLFGAAGRIEGAEFPDWRRLVARRAAEVKAAGAADPAAPALAPRLLARFGFPARLRSAESDPTGDALLIEASGAGGAVFVRREAAPWFLGLVMPMRASGEWSDFAKGLLAPAAAGAAE